MKKFILGLIIGIIISLSFTSFATETITAFANRFPIYLNGVKQDVKAYIINDHLYLQVIDINKIFNTETSFDKDKYDETQNAIYIDSIKPTPKSTPKATPKSESKPTQTPNPTQSPEQTINDKEVDTVPETRIRQTPDGLQVDLFEGKYSIGMLYIKNKAKQFNYDLISYYDKNTMSIKWDLVKSDSTIIKDIPTNIVYGAASVAYDYYINTIMPLFK